MYKCIEDNGFYCISDQDGEPTIPCISKNDAENLCNILNEKNNTINDISDYAADLENDLLGASRHISHLIQKRYGLRDCRRFSYIHNDKDDIYEAVDSLGQFGPWASLVEPDMQYLMDFMNQLWFEKTDLEVELEHKQEEINHLRGLPDAHLLHDLTEDIYVINNIIGFFIENGIEEECVEYESEEVKAILNRLQKVAADYDF